MKVMMLGWELPPHHSGGLGMVCYQMCKELAKQGVDIEFILPYTADYSDIDFMTVTGAHPQTVSDIELAGGIYESQKFKVTYDDGTTEIMDLYGQEGQFIKNVCKLVKLREFDVLHSHDWLTMRAAIAAKRISGKPLIVHIHATEYDRSGGNYGNPEVREIEYQGMMLADKVIAISNYVKSVLVNEYGIPPEKIDVIHNKIDYDLFHFDEGENAFKYLEKMRAHGYRVVSYIGRVTIQKNLVNFLHSMKLVVDHQPKTLLLLVGSGEQERELIETAASLGISQNVIFVPFLKGKNWRDAFRVSDLHVLPSVSEPFGITPLESIGFGTPSLVSYQTGVSEVLTNMLKVDFWDVNEMANQIAAVMSHDALRDELYVNSRNEWHHLGWDQAAQLMRDTYNAGVGAKA